MDDNFFKEYEENNGFELSENYKKLMIKQEFKCDCCGESFKENINLDCIIVNDRRDNNIESVICYDCYEDDYLMHCPICEEYKEKTNEPEKTFFYLHEKHYSLNTGFYKVHKFPVFRSNMFDCDILEENVELVSRNVYYKDSSKNPKADFTDFICEDCFDEKAINNRSIINHIKSKWVKGFSNKKIKTISKIIINVSPEYYDCMKGNKWHKKVKLIKDKTKKTQQISFTYEFK